MGVILLKLTNSYVIWFYLVRLLIYFLYVYTYIHSLKFNYQSLAITHSLVLWFKLVFIFIFLITFCPIKILLNKI